LEKENILTRSHSFSDEETLEILPVSDERQKIDNHIVYGHNMIEMTKKYLFRTERWGCVTIIKKRTAITFAHNEHSTLEVGYYQNLLP
jgi:V8-like Glu-specific endopeptidase